MRYEDDDELETNSVVEETPMLSESSFFTHSVSLNLQMVNTSTHSYLLLRDVLTPINEVVDEHKLIRLNNRACTIL